jgi:hypothetical protein
MWVTNNYAASFAEVSPQFGFSSEPSALDRRSKEFAQSVRAKI